MARSGTTLLDKLLSNHPQATILSQPFPLLFSQFKQAFLESKQLEHEIYPLNSLFLESRYARGDFAEFLQRFEAGTEFLAAAFARMEGYSGQYTKTENYREVLDRILPGNLSDVLSQLLSAFSVKSPVAVVGLKETFCEEFLPYFADSGWRCVLLVRDPRDTIVSLNYGNFRDHVGKRRPVLWDLRKWRKSAAFAIALADHPNVRVLTYRQLVTNPRMELDRLAQFLQISGFPADVAAQPLADQAGGAWRGNSSHENPARGISDESLGKFQSTLDPELVEVIETCCGPEMRYFGFVPGGQQRAGDTLEFAEPFPQERAEFSSYYAQVSLRAAEELQRLTLLRAENVPEDTIQAHFLFPEVYARLKAYV